MSALGCLWERGKICDFEGLKTLYLNMIFLQSFHYEFVLHSEETLLMKSYSTPAQCHEKITNIELVRPQIMRILQGSDDTS